MREVTQFVVIFPGRFIGTGRDEWKLLLRAMHAEYPHYSFEAGRGHNLDEDFKVIPVVGTVGEGWQDADEVYMCKPLDPSVIPDLVRTLQTYEALGASVN
ncbi:hypothetical protein [Devosia ginsengisoli]|uniref:Uncharacterized protein n=1 Tax=Devosia ginsengisoli TaxID=400770 RepID=A0A5B8LQX6_9HYPH|nr:hypothetical protein [Devosia ginsengisoli]QDZ10553.1 hypothetical protein FPZ08_07185 [Devosia ginsengisoli]